MAVKSCLVCRKSYCEIHLTTHLKDQVLTKHGLTDPATFIASHLCRNHNELLEKFCKKDQTPVCMKCTQMDHKNHEIVPMEKESIRIKVKKRALFHLTIYFNLLPLRFQNYAFDNLIYLVYCIIQYN